MSSKSRAVKSALEADERIVIVNVLENNYFPGKYSYFSHTYDYFVAPKSPIYEAEKLQALMVSLVADIKPTQQDEFRQGSASMSYGKLYFDEEIGRLQSQSSIVLTLTDQDFILGAKGHTDGKKFIENKTDEPLLRRVWVRLYPNITLAARALEDMNEYSIDNALLRRHSKGM